MQKCAPRAFLVLALFSGFAANLPAQTLSDSTLNGKYFARHVQFTTDNNNNATDARSITGTITFDGAGNYAFAGQQVIGTNAAQPFNASGTYSLAPAGLLTLTNPENTAFTINARYGSEAVIGSTTNQPPTANVFDLFVAIPAPAANAIPAFGNQTLSVNYHMADFELTNASTAQVRVSGGAAQFDGAGNIQTFQPLGHLASVGNGAAQQNEQFTGTYTVNSDGTGTIGFTPVAGTIPSGALLLAGANRNLYVSATRNVFLGATPGAHDILIGLRDAATDTISFNGRYWLAGFEVDAGQDSENYVLSTSVDATASTVLFTQRIHQVPSIAPGIPTAINQTSNLTYSPVMGFSNTCHCGIGSGLNLEASGGAFFLPGNDGTVLIVGTGVDGSGNPNGESGFTIIIGEQIPTLTGTGVFVNPQGIVNASTYAPVGDPISPGEFIQIYGSGLAPGGLSATMLPFPQTLNGVTVSIGGTMAPLYNVSPGVITCIVPYGLSTNAPATIVVNNNGTLSNSVTVGTSPFTPGVISVNDSGFGDGAITHVDYSLVSSASPAKVGDTVQMYVTGLGALTIPVDDGNGFTGIDDATVQPIVTVNGMRAAVGYWGLTEDAGLYQVNFTIPIGTPSGKQSVVLASTNGTVAEANATVTIAIQ